MVAFDCCQTLKQSYLLLFRFIWFRCLLQRKYSVIDQDVQKELIGLCWCLLQVWLCGSSDVILRRAIEKNTNAGCLIALLHDELQLNVVQYTYLQSKVDYISAQLHLNTDSYF